MDQVVALFFLCKYLNFFLTNLNLLIYFFAWCHEWSWIYIMLFELNSSQFCRKHIFQKHFNVLSSMVTYAYKHYKFIFCYTRLNCNFQCFCYIWLLYFSIFMKWRLYNIYIKMILSFIFSLRYFVLELFDNFFAFSCKKWPTLFNLIIFDYFYRLFQT